MQELTSFHFSAFHMAALFKTAPLLLKLFVLFKKKKKNQFSLACGSSAAMLTNVASSEIHKNK